MNTQRDDGKSSLCVYPVINGMTFVESHVGRHVTTKDYYSKYKPKKRNPNILVSQRYRRHVQSFLSRQN